MTDRILSILRSSGPLTYGALATALGLALAGSIVEFDAALNRIVSDGQVVRDEGERAGRPAVYRAGEGGRG